MVLWGHTALCCRHAAVALHPYPEEDHKLCSSISPEALTSHCQTLHHLSSYVLKLLYYFLVGR